MLLKSTPRNFATFAIVCLACLGIVTSANAQSGPQPAPRTPQGSDYWQPGWMHRQMWDHDRMHADIRARMIRHRTFMSGNIPAIYDNVLSPLSPTSETVKAGADLYASNCSGCHGPRGMGDGAAARSLSPSPALLAHMIQRPVSVDGYLLWTISEGGKKFGTSMPAFKDKLSRDEIWKLVAYMRSGFPKTNE